MKSWSDVKVKNFEAVVELVVNKEKYKSETEFGLRVTAALLGIPYDEILTYSKEQFQQLQKDLEWSNEPVKHTGKTVYIINGRKYAPIPNPNKLTMGAAIDAELMISNSKEYDIISSLLPIVLREVVGNKQLPYSSKDYYKNRKLFSENLSIADVIQLKDFF